MSYVVDGFIFEAAYNTNWDHVELTQLRLQSAKLNALQLKELAEGLLWLRIKLLGVSDDPNDIDDEQYGEGPDYPY